MQAHESTFGSNGGGFKRRLVAAWDLSPAYYGTALLLIAAFIFRPILLSEAFFWVILRQAAPLGMVVLGQSMVMRCLSIDLSTGGVILAVNYIASGPYLSSYPGYLIVSACLVLGLVVGTINGVLITQLRGSAVIITLAMTTVFVGLVVAFARYTPPGDVPSLIRYLGSGRFGRIPIAPMIWIGFVIPAALALRHTVFGRYLDAVGANPNAAALSGIPHLRVIFLTHVFSGLTAAIGGLLLAGFVGTGSTDTGIGQDVILNSIAAVILGGVTFGGGRGRILGPAVGAFMLTFVFNFLTSFGFEESGKLMMQGLIIAVAAMIDGLKKR
jgi:ribose transport system permease protein